MMNRVRYIGEEVVPLTDTYPKGVLFIGRGRRMGEGIVAESIDATGFLASIGTHCYVVTAAHVVSRTEPDYLVRLRLKDGSVKDLPVERWWSNKDPLHDVAVSPIILREEYDLVSTDITQFADDPSWLEHDLYSPLALGDIVYFVGLLANIGAMVDENIPIVRAGTIGRLWQEHCPVLTPEKVLRRITAHLIDCRSFGGFSGSPCYVQQSRAGVVTRDDGSPGITTRYSTALLGLIGGHYDDYADVENTYGKSDHLSVPVNTGVGYVVPVEFIREALMRKELVEMRKQDNEREAREAKRTERRKAGKMDSGSDEPEFERFENLTRQLVNTPKPARKERESN